MNDENVNPRLRRQRAEPEPTCRAPDPEPAKATKPAEQTSPAEQKDEENVDGWGEVSAMRRLLIPGVRYPLENAQLLFSMLSQGIAGLFGSKFIPERDIQDQTDKVILVTG
ncbi:hypothetical protein KEM55_001508, partial [Ascosphaera atra]